MSNVIQLKNYQKITNDNPFYRSLISKMDKLELLEEVERFQARRQELGKLDDSMLVIGSILYRILEKSAETQELVALSIDRYTQYESELEAINKENVK